MRSIAVFVGLVLFAPGVLSQTTVVETADYVLPGIELGSEILYDFNAGNIVHVYGNKTNLVLLRIINVPDPYSKTYSLVSGTAVYPGLLEHKFSWTGQLFSQGLQPISNPIAIIFPQVVLGTEQVLQLKDVATGTTWPITVPPPPQSIPLDPGVRPASCEGIKGGCKLNPQLNGRYWACGDQGRGVRAESDVVWKTDHVFSPQRWYRSPFSPDGGFYAPAGYELFGGQRVRDHIEFYDAQGFHMFTVKNPFQLSWTVNGWTAVNSNRADYRLAITGTSRERADGWDCLGWAYEEASYSITDFELGILKNGGNLHRSSAVAVNMDQGFVSDDGSGSPTELAGYLVDWMCNRMGIEAPEWGPSCGDYLQWVNYAWGNGRELVNDASVNAYILRASVAESGPHMLAVNFVEEINQVDGCTTPGSLTMYASMKERLHLSWWPFFGTRYEPAGQTSTTSWGSKSQGNVIVITGAPADGCPAA